MARERMITRTVETTKARVMCVRVSDQKLTTDELTIGGTFKDNDELLKAIKKQYETADYKPTAIVETTVETILYGIPESKFIEIAEILPPRKVYETE